MASFKNFSKKSRAEKEGSFENFDNPMSHDPINEESIDSEEWKKFVGYYRKRIDLFATEILGLKLHLFQRLILRAMAKYQYVMLICCRGIGEQY